MCIQKVFEWKYVIFYGMYFYKKICDTSQEKWLNINFLLKYSHFIFESADSFLCQSICIFLLIYYQTNNIMIRVQIMNNTKCKSLLNKRRKKRYGELLFSICFHGDSWIRRSVENVFMWSLLTLSFIPGLLWSLIEQHVCQNIRDCEKLRGTKLGQHQMKIVKRTRLNWECIFIRTCHLKSKIYRRARLFADQNISRNIQSKISFRKHCNKQ